MAARTCSRRTAVKGFAFGLPAAALAVACGRERGPEFARGREIVRRIDAQHSADGAGVKLRRSLGSRALPMLDPFLLLDEIHSDRPEDFIAGFPKHPHRGFE